MTSTSSLRFGEWTLHPREGELERAGERQRLQDLPLRILLALLEQPGELVTREQLIAKLWPKGVVEYEGGLNTAISKLRATLGDNADEPRYIETIPRKGYRFIGRVSPPSLVETPAIAAGPRKAPWKRRSVLYATAAIALVAIGSLGVRFLGSSNAPEQLRLAVMPFTNLSADPDNAFFADGLHDEIVATLANRATQLDVISRTTMMTFRGSAVPTPAIARELAATHLLEGAVRREGDDVRVTVSLIDAQTDRQTWTRTFDRRLGAAMTLQTDVAEEVAARLAVELTQDGRALPATTSPVAYDLYLRAKLASQEVTQLTPPEQTRQIEQWLNEAVALDPAFGAAYVERARIRIVRFVRNQDLTSMNIQGGEADIETAQRLLGDRAEVAAIQSRYQAAVHDELRLAVQRLESPAVASSRDPAVMLWRAFALCRADRPDEGLRVYAQVAELDPLNRGIFSSWAVELWSLHRPAEALQVIESFNRRGAGRIDYGDLEFAFTGRVERLRRDVENMDASADPDARLAATFDLLRFEQRFADLRSLILGTTMTTLRQRGFREQQAAGISDRPVAELRGWSALLSGDRAGLEADGKALLDHANRDPSSRRDAAYLQVLRAEGYLFVGNPDQAIANARDALADPTAVPGTNTRRFIGAIAARVLAWAGADDEATEVLKGLASRFPALGPAEVVRDPLYFVPLADNPAFESWARELEAEIELYKPLFDNESR
jgi:TolB-like protein/DNA-binding winged helix-turn-helix (wHTH) protein